MKRFILTVYALCILATLPVRALAADNLSQATRARMENELIREIGPRIGVFDYIAFQLDGNGTVTLSGQVRDAMLKKHAAEDAKKVEGVKRIKNEIEILPVSPSDDDIRLAVYRAIYSQNGFERYRTRAVPPVHVIVKNGTVALEGFVANQIEYAQAKAAANNVPGVFSVRNNLKIDK